MFQRGAAHSRDIPGRGADAIRYAPRFHAGKYEVKQVFEGLAGAVRNKFKETCKDLAITNVFGGVTEGHALHRHMPCYMPPPRLERGLPCGLACCAPPVTCHHPA